jgi:hypothetical protein
VHGVEGFLVALGVGLLVMAWRDCEAVDLADQLAVLLAICTGMVFGVIWELVEFAIDWVNYSDLQKSNTDTMTDFLWSDLGAVIAALITARMYCHVMTSQQRHELGRVAVWLVDGPSRFLDRHGLLATIVVAVGMGVFVAALWFSGRPVPGFPIG